MSNSPINKIADGIANLVAFVASGGLIAMTLMIVWQVFGRYIMNNSPAWSESTAMIVMLYVVLLGAAIGVHEQFHLKLRLFVSRLTPRTALIVYVLGQLLVAGFGLAMVWNGMGLIDYTHSHVIPTLGISRAIAYWPFVIGGILIVVFALERAFLSLTHRHEENPWN